MTMRRGEMREVHPWDGEPFRYRLTESADSFTFDLEGETFRPGRSTGFSVESRQNGEGLCRTESGRTYAFAWEWVGQELHLWLDGDLFVFQRADPSTSSGRHRGSAAANEATGDVLAPMPGSVLEILVEAGDRVERNQTVAIMESMKMELVITAPRDGVVRRIAVQAGQQVERGMRLLELAPISGPGP